MQEALYLSREYYLTLKIKTMTRKAQDTLIMTTYPREEEMIHSQSEEQTRLKETNLLCSGKIEDHREIQMKAKIIETVTGLQR